MSKGSSILSWVAIVLATGTFLFSVVAFNRTGENLDKTIQRQVSEAVRPLEQTLDNQEINEYKGRWLPEEDGAEIDLDIDRDDEYGKTIRLQ